MADIRDDLLAAVEMWKARAEEAERQRDTLNSDLAEVRAEAGNLRKALETLLGELRWDRAFSELDADTRTAIELSARALASLRATAATEGR